MEREKARKKAIWSVVKFSFVVILLLAVVLFVIYANFWYLNKEYPHSNCSTCMEMRGAFGDSFGAANAFFSALAAAAVFFALWFQYRELLQQKQDFIASEMERWESAINSSRTRAIETIIAQQNLLYYCSERISEDSHRDVCGNKVTICAGHYIEELWSSLELCVQSNRPPQLDVYIKQAEIAFQVIGACEPWYNAIRIALDDIRIVCRTDKKKMEKIFFDILGLFGKHQRIVIAVWECARPIDNNKRFFSEEYSLLSPRTQRLISDINKSLVDGDGGISRRMELLTQFYWEIKKAEK